MIAAAAERTISIRPASAGDQAFVAATFAEQLTRNGHHNANALVDRILDSDATRVLVAIDDTTGRIIGWLAYAAIPRVRAALFMYVRRNDRLCGVARSLVDTAWPKRIGAWVHAGLRGGATKTLLARYAATEMPLEELL